MKNTLYVSFCSASVPQLTSACSVFLLPVLDEAVYPLCADIRRGSMARVSAGSRLAFTSVALNAASLAATCYVQSGRLRRRLPRKRLAAA
jgi:hypothetical protein